MNNLKGVIKINVDDLIGKQVGLLTVKEYAGFTYEDTKGGSRVRHYYICECACGKKKKIRRGQLLNEIVYSCGCYRKRRKKNDKNEA